MDFSLLVQTITLILLVALCSYGLSFVSRWCAWKVKAVDVPTGAKKQHRSTTPMFGGLGIFVAGAIGVAVLYYSGFLSPALSGMQLASFGSAAMLLLVTGLLDDRYELSPSILFPLYLVACVLVVVILAFP